MVKRRGYRIELGEIESALYLHPRVREVAVVSVPCDDAGVRLIAVVACDGGEPPSVIDFKTCSSVRRPGLHEPGPVRLPGRTPENINRQGRLPGVAKGRAARRRIDVSASVNGRLSYADRWMRDATTVLRPPYSAYCLSIDMTEALRAAGPGTARRRSSHDDSPAGSGRRAHPCRPSPAAAGRWRQPASPADTSRHWTGRQRRRLPGADPGPGGAGQDVAEGNGGGDCPRRPGGPTQTSKDDSVLEHVGTSGAVRRSSAGHC